MEIVCVASTSISPITPVGYTPLSQITAGNVWFSMAPMPTPRRALAVAAANGKIYAIGGATDPDFTPTSNTLQTLEVYDPSTNTWTTAAPMPNAREHGAAAAVNGKIYAIGGDYLVSGQFIGDPGVVDVYDPSTDGWAPAGTAAPIPTARAGLAAAVVNGKIYAIGGALGFFTSALNVVEVYDPSTNTWTTAAPMPTPRFNLAAAVLNGKIYAIGGNDGLNVVEVYDPSTNTWSTAATMPTPRNYLAASVLNGKIYAIGGASAGSTVEVYDPSTNTWSTAASLPTPRDSLAAADVVGASGDQIYAIGGGNGIFESSGLSSVEQYSAPVTIYTFIKN